MHPSSDFGGRLKAARLSAGLSLQQLGDAVGCTRAYLSSLEHKKRGGAVSADLLYRVAVRLGTSVESLLEGVEPAGFTDDDRAFARRYLALTDAQKDRFRAVCALLVAP